MLQQTLEVCDRYDTGYDNDRVAIVGFDKHITSDEKLVQIYSRADVVGMSRPCPDRG